MNRAHRSMVAKLRAALSPSVHRARPAVVMLVLGASLGLGGMPPVVADTKVRAVLTEEQKIIHLLNRLGYGPRPGDIERLKRIGLERYIDQQLHPQNIDDSATEARLTGLSSLRMTTVEIAEKYPAPQMVARELGQHLPAEAKPEAKSAESSSPQQGSQADDLDARRQQREVRQQILAYYAEHGLNLPRRLLQELQAQKLIRAVYSERQLFEVMTDFWFNHFNVFWSKGADKWLTTDFEMHAIRPHALGKFLGKFKDLLLATAKSPAMLFYLDNFLSSSPDAKMPNRAGQNRPFLERPLRFAASQDAPWRGMGNPLGGTSPFKRDQMATNPQDQPFANELRKRQPGINENDVSPQTRAVLDRQLTEDLPVKGELRDDAATMAKGGLEDDGGSAMMANGSMRARPANKAMPRERGAFGTAPLTRTAGESAWHGWGVEGNAGAAGPAVDPQVTKAFGLVLGSPEFQRR